MGELFKTNHTIDEWLDKVGVQIVLDGEHMTEEDKETARKNGDLVKIKKQRDKEKK
ncbi:tryptophanyl-tRNA synthetase [uncultured Allisonella sp.]|uniref:tryptophanyl-tRNA synthetase n=1 Tax=Allisonella histaminiformans TaxID=209880 RepID=UPI002584AAF0|nr:tryptophanyl-tRNA synthetase [uncultured Allisonella sp.]